MEEKERAVVILSGGMDSTTLLYHALNEGYDIFTLSFNYNQKHKKELKCAEAICEKLGVNHKILNLDILNEIAPSALTREDWDVPEGHYSDENMKQTVVPNRNMIMLSLATSYAISIKAAKVFYGAHTGDHAIYPDCRKVFQNAMNVVMHLCDWNEVSLEVPFYNMNKGDIAVLGKTLNVDYSLTWTCYKGKEKACGKCGSCVERLEAFDYAGIEDPIEYEEV